jgi:hypothetical protein
MKGCLLLANSFVQLSAAGLRLSTAMEALHDALSGSFGRAQRYLWCDMLEALETALYWNWSQHVTFSLVHPLQSNGA